MSNPRETTAGTPGATASEASAPEASKPQASTDARLATLPVRDKIREYAKLAEANGEAAERAAARKKNDKAPGVFRWKGTLDEETALSRRLTFAAIVVCVAALSFTQFGFAGIGTSGNYVAYCIVMLAPIAATALLMGLLPGTLMGLVAGAVMYAHACVQPLDYYELSFVTPFSSIGFLTIAGFTCGFLMSLALRKRPPRWKGAVRVVLICLFASAMFSLHFYFNVFLQLIIEYASYIAQTGQEVDEAALRQTAAVTANRFGSIEVQILVDAALMLATCVVANTVAAWLKKTRGNRSLRITFRLWLLAVVALVFMATTATSFVVITEQAKAGAEATMSSRIEYLREQLKGYDERSAALDKFLAECGVDV